MTIDCALQSLPLCAQPLMRSNRRLRPRLGNIRPSNISVFICFAISQPKNENVIFVVVVKHFWMNTFPLKVGRLVDSNPQHPLVWDYNSLAISSYTVSHSLYPLFEQFVSMGYPQRRHRVKTASMKTQRLKGNLPLLSSTALMKKANVIKCDFFFSLC